MCHKNKVEPHNSDDAEFHSPGLQGKLHFFTKFYNKQKKNCHFMVWKHYFERCNTAELIVCLENKYQHNVSPSLNSVMKYQVPVRYVA